MAGKKKIVLEILLFAVLSSLMSGDVFGQSSSTGGTITGNLKDMQGASIGGAAIKAVRPDTNAEFSVQTDSNGFYQFIHLPPANYRVEVQVEGFEPKAELVPVGLGSTVLVSFKLSPAGMKDVVEVQASNDAVGNGGTENSTSFRSGRIQGLPINQRNLFLDFSLTAARITPDGLPLQGVTATSGLSFNGQPARFNNFTIDGLDNNDTTAGLVRSGLGQDAIQEFQVVSDGYSAEFGRALGGIVNLVTRSGSNEFHGDAFFYLRNAKLNARSAFLPRKPPFEQYQYGLTASGPVKRDRAFFFASAERLNVAQTNTIVFPLQVLKAFQRLNLPVKNGPSPFSIGTVSGLARLDWQTHPTNLLTARFNAGGTHNSAFDQSFENPQLTDDRYSGTQRLDDRSVVVSNTHVLMGLNLVNETRFLFNQRDQTALPPDPSTSQINVLSRDGFVLAGPSSLLPQTRDATTYHVVNNATIGLGRHTVKFGGDVMRINTSQRQPTDELGRLIFSTLDLKFLAARFNLPGDAFILPFQAFDPGLRTPAQRQFLTALSPFLPMLSFTKDFPRNVPLADTPIPEVFLQSFQPQSQFDVSQTFFSVFAQDDFQWRPNLMVRLGARYDLFRTQRLDGNRGNVGPRVGVAYRPGAVPNLSIRAGYGLFFAAPITSPLFFSQRRGAVFLPFPDTIPILSLPGRRLPISDTPPPGTFIPQLSAVSSVSRNFEDAYTQQANLGLDYRLGKTVLSANYVFVKGSKIQSVRNVNPVVRPDPRDPVRALIEGRVDPTRGDVFLFESAYDSNYHAVTFSTDTRIGDRLDLLAHYTYSKAIDDFVDYRADFQEFSDPLNIGNERALSIQDIRNRFVVSGIWNVNDWGRKWLSGFQLSGIFTAQSGRPFNLLTGLDLNRGVNPFVRPFVVGPDGVRRELGRNAGVGPGFVNLDLRLTRTIAPTERIRLVLFAEMFNAFNRVNVSVFNRLFPPASDGMFLLPEQDGGRYVLTADRYRQSFAARQFQFGLRLGF